jgi:hypothetical protein
LILKFIKLKFAFIFIQTIIVATAQLAWAELSDVPNVPSLDLLWPKGPKTFNIYSEPPAGGFGDVASNLIMAENLAETYPNSEINFIYSRSSEAALAKLVTHFKLNTKKQSLNRFHFYNLYLADQLPKADVLFQFSSENVVVNKVVDTARLRLVFTEFARDHIIGLPTEPKGFRILKTQVSTGRMDLIFSTGIDNGGLYLTAPLNSPHFTDDDYLLELNSRSEVKITPAQFREAQIAFAYVSDGELSQVYNETIYQWATQPENKGQIFLLLTKEGYYTDKKNKPTNVIIIPTNTFHLGLSRESITRATLPIFITGDVSFNFAIDASKAFFYEQQSWKKTSISLLISAIRQIDPSLIETWQYGLQISPDFGKRDLGAIKIFFLNIFRDHDLQTRLKRTLNKVKESNSLTINISRFLKEWPAFLKQQNTSHSPAQFEEQILLQWPGKTQYHQPFCSELLIKSRSGLSYLQ